MKKIEIISATPELLESPFSGSIMKRAVEKKIVEINFHDLKNYSSSKQIDDYQFEVDQNGLNDRTHFQLY